MRVLYVTNQEGLTVIEADNLSVENDNNGKFIGVYYRGTKVLEARPTPAMKSVTDVVLGVVLRAYYDGYINISDFDLTLCNCGLIPKPHNCEIKQVL